MGVCLESDICEERLLELKIPLTKLPSRRAVRDCMDGCVIVKCVRRVGGCNKDKRHLKYVVHMCGWTKAGQRVMGEICTTKEEGGVERR